MSEEKRLVRYVWMLVDGKYIYETSEFHTSGRINVRSSKDPIFVNILERVYDNGMTAYKVKLYYSDGLILEGWTTDTCLPIKLINEDQLYDGRFNG